MTLISNDAEDLSHDKFTKLLLKEPTVAELVATGPRRGKGVSFALSNNSIETGDHTSVSSSSYADENYDNEETQLSKSVSSNSTVGRSSTGSTSAESGRDDVTLEKQSQEYVYRASAVPNPTVVPALFVQTNSTPSSSIISAQGFSWEDEGSSLNPLTPITRISIHTGDDS